MKASLLLVTLMLTACMLPAKQKNPEVAKRPLKTGKFLSNNDYYIDETKPKKAEVKEAAKAELERKEPVKEIAKESPVAVQKEATIEEKKEQAAEIKKEVDASDADKLPEPEEISSTDYPSNKHYKKPKNGFSGFEYNESNDEQYESLDNAESEPETPLYEQEGLASWYGPGFHGRKTANGESFNQNGLTAAHRKYPMGSMVEVTNLDNGKSVTVRINDRGPYSGKRIIDLSKAAAKELDMLHDGVAKVGIKQVDE